MATHRPQQGCRETTRSLLSTSATAPEALRLADKAMSISRHPAQVLRLRPLRAQQLHSRQRLHQRPPLLTRLRQLQQLLARLRQRLQLQLRQRSRLRQHQQLLTPLRLQQRLQLQPRLHLRQQRQLLLLLLPRPRPQLLPRPRQRLHPHQPLLQDLHRHRGLARQQGLGQLRRRAHSWR
jgi:hypothetical protein